MTAPSIDGDLTDISGWERTWRRSPNRKRPPNNAHGALFESNFTYALRSCDSQVLDILEIGCAPGDMLVNMAAVAPEHRYSGVDFAPTALAETATRLGSTVELHCSDVRTFAPVRAYDLVVSFGLIEHFDDPREIVSHHARLARSGGAIGVMIPNYSHAVLREALKLYSPETLRTHNIEMMRADYLVELLEDVGLIDVECGSYGGAIIPVAHALRGVTGTVIRKAASVWNRTFRVLPPKLSPWQGFLWARGRRP